MAQSATGGSIRLRPAAREVLARCWRFWWRRLFFDPTTYLVAVDQASGQYARLVRIWRSRGGPRLGLIATLARYRRRGVARALLGHVFAVLAARGDMSVAGEVDDTNVASVALLTGLAARRYGGNVELIRRQPDRSARKWPPGRRPPAGR